jgi:hypothetical protein
MPFMRVRLKIESGKELSFIAARAAGFHTPMWSEGRIFSDVPRTKRIRLDDDPSEVREVLRRRFAGEAKESRGSSSLYPRSQLRAGGLLPEYRKGLATASNATPISDHLAELAGKARVFVFAAVRLRRRVVRVEAAFGAEVLARLLHLRGVASRLGQPREACIAGCRRRGRGTRAPNRTYILRRGCWGPTGRYGPHL